MASKRYKDIPEQVNREQVQPERNAHTKKLGEQAVDCYNNNDYTNPACYPLLSNGQSFYSTYMNSLNNRN